MNDFYYYQCDKCGGKFISSRKIPHCIFCYEEILEKNVSYDFTSFYFGSFQKSIEDAKKMYQKKCRNPLIPGAFRKKEILDHICKCYVPCYFFNSNVNGKVNYTCKEKNKCQKYKTVMKVNIDYQNEFVAANSKISSSLLNQISNTFQYDLFDYKYLEDGVALDIDVDEDRVKEFYHQDIINYTLLKSKEKVPHQLKKSVSQEIEIQDSSNKLVYIPIYYVRISYQGNDYFFIMNGEDGNTFFKTIVGKFNIILFSVILFIIIYLLALLLIKIF